MLATQVSYWTLQESKRHNIATEDLGNRTLNETVRHNVVTEGETQRHNVAQEDYWNNSLQETIRHNIATENLGTGELEVAYMNAFTNQRNAATNEMNAKTNIRNAETNVENMKTNRFGTWSNYNLGLDANRIAQENVDIRSLEERDKWYSTVVGDRSQETNARNADTNALNAVTNQQNAATNAGNLNLNQNKFEWQQFTDVIDMGLKAANTANNVMSNVLQLITP